MSRNMLANRVYKPKISSAPLYEENYQRLRVLLPDLDSTERAVAYNDERNLSLRVEVMERFKYTTTLHLSLFPVADNPHFASCQLTIRIYRDARMAEVIGFQQQRRIASSYQYPNKKMFQPDEKRQVNVLLQDVFNFCQQQAIRFMD